MSGSIRHLLWRDGIDLVGHSGEEAAGLDDLVGQVARGETQDGPHYHTKRGKDIGVGFALAPGADTVVYVAQSGKAANR